MEWQKFKVSFTKPKDHPFPIISWLIRLVTWCDCSHVLYKFQNQAFHVYFNWIGFVPLKEIEERHEVVHEYELEVDQHTMSLIMGRAIQFNDKKTTGYYLQLIGVALCMPMRLFNKNIWYENPLAWFDSRLCSQYIMEDLLLTTQAYLYVKLYYYDAVHALNSFTEKDLKVYLDYLIEIQKEKQLPFKVTKIK